MKKILLFAIGLFLIIAGITLVFKQWDAVVMLFQGISGMLLALIGMIILFAATIKS